MFIVQEQNTYGNWMWQDAPLEVAEVTEAATGEYKSRNTGPRMPPAALAFPCSAIKNQDCAPCASSVRAEKKKLKNSRSQERRMMHAGCTHEQPESISPGTSVPFLSLYINFPLSHSFPQLR